MSIIISATAFMTIYGTIMSTIIAAKTVSNQYEKKVIGSDLGEIDENFLDKFIENPTQNNISDIHISNVGPICKKYQTIYMDKDLLIKTLKEHGLNEFSISDETITCRIEGFSLKFYKEPEMPYILEVKYINDNNLEEIVQNLDIEYEQNVQENTYLKIKDRLDKKNLQIDSEEILEDDSILLTINLD